LVKWRYHDATWQPAKDLKGQDQALWKFHDANPEKPGPPRWLKRRALSPPAVQPRRSTRQRTALRRVAFAVTQHAVEVDRWDHKVI